MEIPLFGMKSLWHHREIRIFSIDSLVTIILVRDGVVWRDFCIKKKVDM